MNCSLIFKTFIFYVLMTLSFFTNSYGEESRNLRVPFTILCWNGDEDFSFLDSREKIINQLENVKMARINAVAIVVKLPSGEVLYPSKIAPRFALNDDKTVDMDFDLLKVALEEGHKRGIKIYPLLYVFSEGNKLSKTGTLFKDPSKAYWASVCFDRIYDEPFVTVPKNEYVFGIERRKNFSLSYFIAPTTAYMFSSMDKYAYVNPLLPDAQKYEIDVVKEVLELYPGYRWNTI